MYRVRPYSVDSKKIPMSETVLSKCSFIWNKGSVNTRNDHNFQKYFVRWTCIYFPKFLHGNTIDNLPSFDEMFHTQPLSHLLTNLVKSRSCETGCYNVHFALKFYGHFGSAAADVPVKFQSDWESFKANFVASILYKILRQDVRQFS